MTFKSRPIATAITTIAFTSLTTGVASAQSSHHLNAYSTAHLQQQLNGTSSASHSFENSLRQNDPEYVGLGLGYKIKFGQNVAANEKYGQASLNFNTSFRGNTGQAPLAMMSFGTQDYVGYDRFSLSEQNAENGMTVNFQVLGFNVNRLNADDDSDKKDSGTDLGDIGLAAGGIGLLLFGGTIAIAYIEAT